MSREIKFRGLTKESNTWEYGDLGRDKNNKWFIHFYDCNGFECSYEVYPETVSQYTGLQDKNHKEIYEGDIATAEESKIICEVVYTEGAMFMLKWHEHTEWGNNEYHHYGLGAFTLEVIGNIYENKELLEVEHE